MLIHAVMMLQEKVSKESVRDRRDVLPEEAREAVLPGTLPAVGLSVAIRLQHNNKRRDPIRSLRDTKGANRRK